MAEATLLSIVYKPEGGPAAEDAYTRVPVDAAELVLKHGIKGDAKGSTGSRQLNIMSADMVAALNAEGYNTKPGALGEQLVIAGVDLEALPPGSLLAIGSQAQVEVVKLRTGCSKFERYQGRPQSETVGRLGILAIVVTEGTINVGDAVAVLPPAQTELEL